MSESTSTPKASSESLKPKSKAQKVWLEFRSFARMWLAFTSLGGFFVLVFGSWLLDRLRIAFGPAGATPGRVITFLMLLALPMAIYSFLQARKLAEGEVFCDQCGEKYSKKKSSCPMCGCVRAQETPASEPAPKDPAPANS